MKAFTGSRSNKSSIDNAVMRSIIVTGNSSWANSLVHELVENGITAKYDDYKGHMAIQSSFKASESDTFRIICNRHFEE